MAPDSITAFGGDNVSLTNCGNHQQAESFQYIHDGVLASSLPGNSQQGPVWEGITCSGNQSLATADGTFYTTDTAMSYGYPTYRFEAMKNGRVLWQTDVSSPSICGAMSTWGADQNDAQMTYASQGSDGDIYGIIQAAQPGCATYLAKVDGATGTILFKQQLTADGSERGGRLWVYDDKLLTVSTSGLLRQFGYDGTENTSASYQFPSSLGGFGGAYANADGRVFAVGACTGSMTDTFLAYHDPNGDNYVGASGLGCNPNVSYTVGGNGSLVAYDPHDTATTFHFTTTSVTGTSVTVPRPSGVTYSYNDGYWQDQSGNAITVRQFYTGSWALAGMSVDYINGTTGVVSNVFSMGVDTDHPNPQVSRNDIAGGYLYSLICHNMSQCPSTASTSLDEWIHKIQLPSAFGTVVKDTGQFATYTSTKLNYVAMGDSFSSGEGNGPFLTGTDVSGVNTCHRSSAAYPEQLETSLLNWNLTDFVACSGATTDNVLHGGQFANEPAQVGALNDTTNAVTITIGGNDVDFVNFGAACVAGLCDEDSNSYANSANLIANILPGNLKVTYETILQDAKNAQIYVVGYPQMAPIKSSSDPVDNTCPFLYGENAPIHWTEAQAARDLVSVLDQTISNEVETVRQENADYSSRLHYIDVNTSGSSFVGHAMCDSNGLGSSYFNNVDQIIHLHPTWVFHPNASGHLAYSTEIINAITGGIG